MSTATSVAQNLSAAEDKAVRLDIFSDIACPWCYLGEARLDKALAQSGVRAEVRWRPFQLQPGLPPEGVPWRPFAERKFGDWERALYMFGDLKRLGEAEGLQFDFKNIAKANNTADAHRLVLYAEERALGREASHGLYRAYFEQGRDLNDLDVLTDLARVVGLDADDVGAYLESEKNADRVVASQAKAAELGIRGVPFYIFNGRIGMSGAQPTEVFVRALEQSLAEAS